MGQTIDDPEINGPRQRPVERRPDYVSDGGEAQAEPASVAGGPAEAGS